MRWRRRSSPDGARRNPGPSLGAHPAFRFAPCGLLAGLTADLAHARLRSPPRGISSGRNRTRQTKPRSSAPRAFSRGGLLWLLRRASSIGCLCSSSWLLVSPEPAPVPEPRHLWPGGAPQLGIGPQRRSHNGSSMLPFAHLPLAISWRIERLLDIFRISPPYGDPFRSIVRVNIDISASAARIKQRNPGSASPVSPALRFVPCGLVVPPAVRRHRCAEEFKTNKSLEIVPITRGMPRLTVSPGVNGGISWPKAAEAYCSPTGSGGRGGSLVAAPEAGRRRPGIFLMVARRPLSSFASSCALACWAPSCAAAAGGTSATGRVLISTERSGLGSTGFCGAGCGTASVARGAAAIAPVVERCFGRERLRCGRGWCRRNCGLTRRRRCLGRRWLAGVDIRQRGANSRFDQFLIVLLARFALGGFLVARLRFARLRFGRARIALARRGRRIGRRPCWRRGRRSGFARRCRARLAGVGGGGRAHRHRLGYHDHARRDIDSGRCRRRSCRGQEPAEMRDQIAAHCGGDARGHDLREFERETRKVGSLVRRRNPQENRFVPALYKRPLWGEIEIAARDGTAGRRHGYDFSAALRSAALIRSCQPGPSC